jgi:hypothetical protein
VLYQKRDLIAIAATSMTFPLPAFAVLALKQRERWVLILMKRTMRVFLRVFAKAKVIRHQVWQRQPALGLVNLRPELGVFGAVEVTVAHYLATSCSLANAASLSVNVKPSTPQASEFG